MVGVNVMCCAILAFGLVFSATGGVGLRNCVIWRGGNVQKASKL